jgi:hypothetical protein
MNKIITISIIYTIIIGFSLFPSIKSDNVCQIKLDESIDLFLGEYISDSIQSNLSYVNYNYISRDTIMEIAKGFLNHEWYPTEDNIFHGTYYGKEVDTPELMVGRRINLLMVYPINGWVIAVLMDIILALQRILMNSILEQDLLKV